MSKVLVKKAFTLIELLVVVAIIALLISILLPALQGAREQGKKTVCLSNLKQIAQASLCYATDDAREQLVPIHRSMVSTLSGGGFGGTEWSWRTAQPYSFGGRTATRAFPTESGTVGVLSDDTGIWAARTKPLNRYIYTAVDQGDSKKMELYHCPSDTGYPDSPWVQDAPPQAINIPLYEMLGNGYRINVCGCVWLQGSSMQVASFSVGAWGHTASSLEGPSRVVMYSEPLFYNFSRQDGTWNPEMMPTAGWHKKMMSDNVGYADGSAKMTRVDKLAEFDQDTLNQMNITTSFATYYFLRRGRTWQTDAYPSPGALILVYTPAGTLAWPTWSQTIGAYTGWPFTNYKLNELP